MLNPRFWKAPKGSALPCENPQQIIFVDGASAEFPVLGRVADRGYPSPPWSIEIIELGEIIDLIYGLQSLMGKILSRKGLAVRIGFSRNSEVFFLY